MGLLIYFVVILRWSIEAGSKIRIIHAGLVRLEVECGCYTLIYDIRCLRILEISLFAF